MIMSEDRDNIRELLSAYIDGEVTQDQARTIEQAVAKDPELALELHELTATRRLVTGLSRQRAPRGFVRKVMARAERKHLLSDRQAGGAFAAARWITLAVAAVVLLTAGIGIIAINMLGTAQDPSPIANLDHDDGGSDGPGDMGFDDGSLHSEGGDGRKLGAKAGVGTPATGSGAGGGRLVIADAAFDYAVANAKNTSIYTHDVSNTLAVLNETLDRNDVLPLELEAPGRDSKAATEAPAKSAEKKRGVSRGGLNFYYNKKQDDQQVQIVVLATDTVIEQLNGDLDKLARVQKVSQAPASDYPRGRSDTTFVARGTARRGSQKDTDPSGRDGEGTVIARVDGVHTGLGVTGEAMVGKSKGDGIRAKGKMKTDGGAGVTPGQAAPAPVVTPAPKDAKPAVDTHIFGGENDTPPVDVAAATARGAALSGSKLPRKAVSQTGNAGENNDPATAVTNAGEQKKEFISKGDKPKPATPKRVVAEPTTRPAETVEVAGGILQKGLGDGKDSGELEILSAQIAKEQRHGKSIKQLEEQYSKLNSAFRQQILNDDVRRNVQSQQERGINVQALVININRRNLGSDKTATSQSSIRLRDDQALSRPRATTKSSPVPESTTKQATPPVDAGR